MVMNGIKASPFKVKAAGPDDGLKEGQFEGYASVFGNVDSYGDIVEKGAFADSLKSWQEKGDPIPLLWGHDMEDPFSNIGSIDFAEEDDHGLKVRGTFDTDNPKAQQVYRLTKGRRATGMSFAYAVQDSRSEKDANYLTKLHIFEASIVPIGANQLAGVDAVKASTDLVASAVKSGKSISSENQQKLRDAISALESVLESDDDEQDDEEDDSKKEDEQESDANGADDGSKSGANDETQGSKSSAADEAIVTGPSAEDLAAKYQYEALLLG